MPIIKFGYERRSASEGNGFQKAKDYMKKVLRHRFKDHAFGLYAKYDVQNDVITMWLTQPADTKRFLENIIDGEIDLKGDKEAGFRWVKGQSGFLKKKQLEEAINHWPIGITGPISQNDMPDCFTMIDFRFEQFEEQAKPQKPDE